MLHSINSHCRISLRLGPHCQTRSQLHLRRSRLILKLGGWFGVVGFFGSFQYGIFTMSEFKNTSDRKHSIKTNTTRVNIENQNIPPATVYHVRVLLSHSPSALQSHLSFLSTIPGMGSSTGGNCLDRDSYPLASCSHHVLSLFIYLSMKLFQARSRTLIL
jgi:hypothetical protein